jgi:hypothetical protein
MMFVLRFWKESQWLSYTFGFDRLSHRKENLHPAPSGTQARFCDKHGRYYPFDKFVCEIRLGT